MKSAMRKERRVYFFDCTKCGNRRSSFKKSKALKGICRKCRRNQVPDNQLHLFVSDDYIAIPAPKVEFDVPFYELPERKESE